jgi:hypothetical protein
MGIPSDATLLDGFAENRQTILQQHATAHWCAHSMPIWFWCLVCSNVQARRRRGVAKKSHPLERAEMKR